MDKLTGYGRPHAHLVGEVGQHYEDLDTGDIYECRIASEYSPTHGWPVGGYVWEPRVKGEDIKDDLACDMRIELSGYLWNNITSDNVRIASGSVQNVIDKIWSGKPVTVKVRSVNHEGSYVAQAKEIEADVCYYGGWLIVNWLCANSAGGWHAKGITFNADGTVKGVTNRTLTTTT